MTAITPAFTGALTRLAWERTSAPAHDFQTTGEVWQIRYPYSVPWGYHYEISLMEVQPDRLPLLPTEFHEMEPRLRDGQTWYFIEIFSHWGASCLSDAG
jgi:hypothetical protein